MTLSLNGITSLSCYLFYFLPESPTFVVDLLCGFAPMFGYLDQMRRVIFSHSTECFKMHSSLVLIVSNFLRIVYWYGNHFARYLLWQALITLFVQTTLIFFSYLYTETMPASPDQDYFIRRRQYILSFKRNSFVFFVLMLFLFFVGVIFVTKFSLKFFSPTIVYDTIGLISNLIDSFVTFPPFYIVVIKRNIQYTTDLLVLQWDAACVCKAFLYFCRPVPWTFRVGVAFQILFTVGITITYTYLSRKKKSQTEMLIEKDTEESIYEEEENCQQLPLTQGEHFSQTSE